MIRLSIIVPFLNSHEIVRRQCLWMRRQDFPDSVEIIYLDDGSDPPLQVPEDPPRNFRLVPTNDFRPWTSSLARNEGARLARGDWLLMTDGDYIITRAAVERALRFRGDRLGCRRRFGVLDEWGELRTDRDTLLAWGLLPELVDRRRGWAPTHPNNFIIRKAVFERMGGYDEELVTTRDYPQKDDTDFKRRVRNLANAGVIEMSDENRPTLFMFPNGQFCGDVDFNPFGLFHTLTRKTDRNHWYHNPRYVREKGC